MTVSIVTDSAAALPSDLAVKRKVAVVPMQITLGGESHPCDEIELSTILQHLDDGVDVTTSGPSPGDFAAAIEGADGDEVLVLTIASTMSSTHEAAVLAARLTERPVSVIDTRTAAGAEGLVVLAASAAASAGKTLAEVEQVAGAALADVRLMASIAGLDHLVRSGRVPAIAGWAGNLLGLQPLFEFRDGEARKLRPAASRDGALDRIVDTWRRSRIPDARLHLSAMHAMDPAGAANLLERVSAEVQPASSFVGEFSPVMVAHTGPGLVGLAWHWERAV
jgi:DegV family protein with EDD domain